MAWLLLMLALGALAVAWWLARRPRLETIADGYSPSEGRGLR